MNDFLVTYLDTIDERLLEYLDEDDEMPLALAKRLREVTTALMDGEVTPVKVLGEWPDYFALSGAFVASYGSEEPGGVGTSRQLFEGCRGRRREAHGGRPPIPSGVGVGAGRLPRDAKALGLSRRFSGKRHVHGVGEVGVVRWRYLTVVAMWEWPRRRWTRWMSTPRRRGSLRSCDANCGGSAYLHTGLLARV